MSDYYEKRYSLHVQDSELVANIESIRKENSSRYKSDNQTIIDLLYRAVDSYQSEKIDIKKGITNGELLNEIQRILKLLFRMVDSKKASDKETYVGFAIQEKLSSRLYNFIVNNALKNEIPYSSFEKGLLDDLPEDLENEKDTLRKEFDANGNNT